MQFYLDMVCVVLMIKRDDIIVFIEIGTTQLPKLVDFSILPFPCLQMISNLITSPVQLEMFIQSFSTSIEMNFLETR